MLNLPLIDSFDRVHTNLRVSVTDRCNIRCFYCMPEQVQFLPRKDVLSFEEIERVVRVFASLGINRIRLTGGEPLVRAEVWKLVSILKGIVGIEEISMTTNGVLLADQAERLRTAGLDRLNISLDTVDPKVFEKITRRQGLDKTLAGIEAAQQAGFKKIRINAVSIVGLTESEIVPLARFARDHDLELRFIEFMPLDGDEAWESDQVLSGKKVRQIIESELGHLELAERTKPSQPAIDFRYREGQGTVGFINSVTEPFCGHCDRLRITANGKIRNCLFSDAEWDIKQSLRSAATDAQIANIIRECVIKKRAGHGSNNLEFLRPNQSMHQIGG